MVGAAGIEPATSRVHGLIGGDARPRRLPDALDVEAADLVRAVLREPQRTVGSLGDAIGAEAGVGIAYSKTTPAVVI